MIREGHAHRAGFVSTNSIRGGANRTVLEHIRSHHVITDAWSDEKWTVDGAAVRVSLVCFEHKNAVDTSVCLNGVPVKEIFGDLTSGAGDFTTARELPENRRVSFEGTKKYGPFDVSGEIARNWLVTLINPNCRPNSDIVKPYFNARDIVKRSSDTWVIDFGNLSHDEAALYERPFQYALEKVKPVRENDRNPRTRERWWLFERARPDLRAAIHGLSRYIATPRVAKHRVFVWLDGMVLPDTRLVVIARDDDTTFGILQSRWHEIWSLRTCSWHGVGNDPTYNRESVFGTFPFPDNLTPNLPAASYAANPHAQAIAEAARRLDELRRNWLNPPSHVTILPEVVPGFPDRIVPIDDKAAAVLKKRTLTNLYNDRPTWLVNAHRDLDAAVAAAYGWPTDISADEALARLLALNHARTVGLSAASMIELDAEEVEFA